MINAPQLATDILEEVGFEVVPLSTKGRESISFEDATVIGFLFSYSDPAALIRDWQEDARSAIAARQLALRRAGQKAWNVYVVLVSFDAATHAQLAALSAIEEDLAGTRKIARAHVQDTADLRAALLPLLPLQAAPKLESVDIRGEIRNRASELPTRALDAFISSAEESVVLQVLEEP